MDTYIEQMVRENRGADVKTLCAQARETRPERVRRAFQAAAQKSDYRWLEVYAALALGEDTEAADRRLYGYLTTRDQALRRELGLTDPWSLVVNPVLIRLYYYFGSKGRGMLSTKTEATLLELLWERMLNKNDITLTRESVWHMTGSENHDLNFKACSLITSQIFMELQDYGARPYSDAGRGGGSGYWFHSMYEFMGGDLGESGPEGGARRGDGTPRFAREHYEAWVKFFCDYFRQRAQRGFFLEASATGYMKWTLSFISLIMEFCQDQELRSLAYAFFDLIWCEWGQEQIGGRRGGAKTRFVFEEAQMQNDSMYYMARFLLGGEGIGGHSYYFQLLSDYELPEIVWDMVVNRHEMGCYEYRGRRPGEEEAVFPRPAGEERTLLCDTQSRMLHYSYVTPDYILGTQMDHPYLVHSHLSCSNRWNGLLLGMSPDAYVFPCSWEEGETDGVRQLRPTGRMYRSVQYKDTLICAQHRGYFRADPPWFPQADQKPCPYGICLGKRFEDGAAEGDWIFVRDGDSYAAFRPAYGRCRQEGPRRILFDDPYVPAIVIGGGRASYQSFADFRRNVLARTLTVRNTVVPGYYTVTIHTGETELYFNAANSEPPSVDGKCPPYDYPWAFESPYISGKYGGGLVTVKKGGRTLRLDFRDQSEREGGEA